MDRPRGQTEGVHRELIVPHVLAEDIGDATRPSLALEFGMTAALVYAFLNSTPCRIGRLSQVLTYLAEETARLLEYVGTSWKYDRVGSDPGRLRVDMK